MWETEKWEIKLFNLIPSSPQCEKNTFISSFVPIHSLRLSLSFNYAVWMWDFHCIALVCGFRLVFEHLPTYPFNRAHSSPTSPHLCFPISFRFASMKFSFFVVWATNFLFRNSSLFSFSRSSRDENEINGLLGWMSGISRRDEREEENGRENSNWKAVAVLECVLCSMCYSMHIFYEL